MLKIHTTEKLVLTNSGTCAVVIAEKVHCEPLDVLYLNAKVTNLANLNLHQL